MSRWVVGAPVVLIAVAFAGCLEDGEAMTLERPQWSSGYNFSYLTTGSAQYEMEYLGSDDSGERSGTEQIGPTRELLEVVSTSRAMEDVPLYLALAENRKPGEPAPSTDPVPTGASQAGNQPFVMGRTRLTAYRQSDLGHVNVGFGVTRNCTNDVCESSMSELSFGPANPFTYLDFPLESGKTWSGQMEGSSQGMSDWSWQVSAKVGRSEWIDLPMGRTRTLPVEFTFEPIGLEQFVRDAVAEDDELDSMTVEASAKMTVFYSPDYQTVVRAETHERYASDASGTEDGKPARAHSFQDLSTVTTLDGARLTQRPERDDAYLLEVLSGRRPIADPLGVAQRSADYRLEVSPATKIVNAAEKPEVEFKVNLLGDASAAAQDKITWKILDFDSNPIQQGDGTKIGHVFDAPGHYTVEVESRDPSGSIASAASAFVIANYEATVPIDCPHAAVLTLLPGCAATPIPVRPGIKSLTVGAASTALHGLVGNSDLVLSDPKGQKTTDTSSAGGRYEIVLDDFSASEVGAKDWSLQLVQQLAVLEDVTYTIKLDYGSEPQVEDTAQGGTSPFGIGLRPLGRSTMSR